MPLGVVIFVAVLVLVTYSVGYLHGLVHGKVLARREFVRRLERGGSLLGK